MTPTRVRYNDSCRLRPHWRETMKPKRPMKRHWKPEPCQRQSISRNNQHSLLWPDKCVRRSLCSTNFSQPRKKPISALSQVMPTCRNSSNYWRKRISNYPKRGEIRNMAKSLRKQYRILMPISKTLQPTKASISAMSVIMLLLARMEWRPPKISIVYCSSTPRPLMGV